MKSASGPIRTQPSSGITKRPPIRIPDALNKPADSDCTASERANRFLVGPTERVAAGQIGTGSFEDHRRGLRVEPSERLSGPLPTGDHSSSMFIGDGARRNRPPRADSSYLYRVGAALPPPARPKSETAVEPAHSGRVRRFGAIEAGAHCGADTRARERPRSARPYCRPGAGSCRAGRRGGRRTARRGRTAYERDRLGQAGIQTGRRDLHVPQADRTRGRATHATRR